MEQMKAYKFRIYPSKIQKELIEKSFGCTRFVYNNMLALQIKAYEEQGKSHSKYDLVKMIPGLKKEYEWLKEVDSTCLQATIEDLDSASQNFFKEIKKGNSQGFPKFKSKRNPKRSFESKCVNNNISIKENLVKLPKLKWVRAKITQTVDGKILNATISKTPTGKYFVSLCCKVDIEQLEKVNSNIGIDLGLKEFIIENNFRKIKIGKEIRQIYIDDVLVVPESYGLKANGVMAQCEKGLKTLVVDIGGGTTDIAEFDEQGNFIDGESIKYGLLDLYRNTRKVLGNKPYNLDIDLSDAKKYFDGDLELLNKDTSYKRDIMLQCIKIIVNELRGLYPNLSNTNIILTGGGAEKVYPTFKKLYEQTIPVSYIKANAKGFYKIGVKAWQGK